jgi:hypothetical protein
MLTCAAQAGKGMQGPFDLMSPLAKIATMEGNAGPFGGLDGRAGPFGGLEGHAGAFGGLEGPSPFGGLEGHAGAFGGLEGPSPFGGLEGQAGPLGGLEGHAGPLGCPDCAISQSDIRHRIGVCSLVLASFRD